MVDILGGAVVVGRYLGPLSCLLSPVVNTLHWGKVQARYEEGHLAVLLRELKRVNNKRGKHA